MRILGVLVQEFASAERYGILVIGFLLGVVAHMIWRRAVIGRHERRRLAWILSRREKDHEDKMRYLENWLGAEPVYFSDSEKRGDLQR